jgi:hypothetical protein
LALIRHPQFYETKPKLSARVLVALADGETSMMAANDLAVRQALELAGIEFIDENGGGPGLRLRTSAGKTIQITLLLGVPDLAAGDPGDHDSRANHVCGAA